MSKKPRDAYYYVIVNRYVVPKTDAGKTVQAMQAYQFRNSELVSTSIEPIPSRSDMVRMNKKKKVVIA